MISAAGHRAVTAKLLAVAALCIATTSDLPAAAHGESRNQLAAASSLYYSPCPSCHLNATANAALHHPPTLNVTTTSPSCHRRDGDGAPTINHLKCNNNGDAHFCWGYESDCQKHRRRFYPNCTHPLSKHIAARYGGIKTLSEQAEKFWSQGDFGYIKRQREEMMTLCTPSESDSVQGSWPSRLSCTSNMRYCEADYIMINFTSLLYPPPHRQGRRFYFRHRPDLWRAGDIGGNCHLNKQLLSMQNKHSQDSLRSWYLELEQYSEMPRLRSDNHQICDVVIEKPVVFQKMDVGVNMYHHFCDFINLYITLHMNGSLSDDFYYMMWDTTPMKYGDYFNVTYKSFTKHDVHRIHDYAGKTVCFKRAVFSFLARQVEGIYYNLPLVPGCKHSLLFDAFRGHILTGLNLTAPVGTSPVTPSASTSISPHTANDQQDQTNRTALHAANTPNFISKTIKVLFLNRTTKDRRIVNINALYQSAVALAEERGDMDVRIQTFSPAQVDFRRQLEETKDTDILVGIHGAGLTHMLFLPPWAAVVEIYDCGDHCYYELSRLRGINYFTWSQYHSDMFGIERHGEGKHPKEFSYSFNTSSFMNILQDAIESVADALKFPQR